ncbi:haloacid dehalogenase [Aaosphaeria arxii CBS 175.79]|uniref:Haloacid dehalogenase n=1 Tax=Aaosphaeria arxii CBS 175.79 TaxID=1450172 RepID=A0A6A5XZG5_9PLEO|nr:haloacid dehalogenase [Aaosphaeria arxii CBS 175.79]KAF2018366.1 haloacid dehalogenase [Aaosphaeria arxii CBS 175.79]
MSPSIVLAFDVYGTLLSTSSIASKLSQHFGAAHDADALATEWRRTQLEYTFRLNSMGKYHPFTAVTRTSLLQTLLSASIPTPTEETISDIMAAYDALEAFPDVAPLLTQLESPPSSSVDKVTAVLFSNGTRDMIASSMANSRGMKGRGNVFGKVVVVDDVVRRYKPAPEVYRHLCEEVGREEGEGVWLVSGNPFDVVGAKAFGLRAAWVDREGRGWVDRLLDGDEEGLRPDVVVRGVDEVVGRVEEFLGTGK